jgi:hypothetical protein
VAGEGGRVRRSSLRIVCGANTEGNSCIWVLAMADKSMGTRALGYSYSALK